MKNFKQLNREESCSITGGFWIKTGVRIGHFILGGLAWELGTEGWSKCKSDFVEGFKSKCIDC